MSEPWILTVGGRKVFPFNFGVEHISIHDVAYALAGEYRFGGHCWPRYTVAQHSVLVSQYTPDPHKLAGLLHDSSEYILRDIPRPLKQDDCFTEYRSHEYNIMRVFAEHYKFEWPNPAVEQIDRRLSLDEARLFMQHGIEDCPCFAGVEPLGIPYIHAWKPEQAEAMFLNRFEDLCK